jgi:hypothetical protein
MPESKGRPKRDSRVPVDPARAAVPQASPRWLVPAMLGTFLFGLAWIVLYYIVPSAPVLSDLGGWNLVIGFAFIMVGFGLSTRWR